MGVNKHKRGAAGGRPEVVDGEDCRMEAAAAMELLAQEARLVVEELPRAERTLRRVIANDLGEERRQGAVVEGLAGLAEDLTRLYHHLETRPEARAEAEEARAAKTRAAALRRDLRAALAQDRDDDPVQVRVARDVATLHQRLLRFAERLERDAEGLRKSDLREGETDAKC